MSETKLIDEGYFSTPSTLKLESLDEFEELLMQSQVGRLYGQDRKIGLIRPLVRTRKSLLQFSLLRQLPSILEFDPGVILFTASSAVPMADVFRGVYDKLSITRPRLEIVQTLKEPPFKSAEKREAERLASKLADQRVAVVDQYVFSGASILSGLRVATLAGAADTLPVPGRWYGDYPKHAHISENPNSASIVDTQLSLRLHQIGQNLADATFKSCDDTLVLE